MIYFKIRRKNPNKFRSGIQGGRRLSEFRKFLEEIFQKSVAKRGFLKSQRHFSDFLQKMQKSLKKGTFILKYVLKIQL